MKSAAKEAQSVDQKEHLRTNGHDAPATMTRRERSEANKHAWAQRHKQNSLSMEDAKKIHHTLISIAQSCLELAKLVDV